jgi:hypothetical protein
MIRAFIYHNAKIWRPLFINYNGTGWRPLFTYNGTGLRPLFIYGNRTRNRPLSILNVRLKVISLYYNGARLTTSFIFIMGEDGILYLL